MIARPGIASSARSITAGFGRVDHDRRLDGHREQLDDLRHLLGFVAALGDRDADVEHVRARLDLLARDVGDALVVVGEQQALHLARALRVDALADRAAASDSDRSPSRAWRTTRAEAWTRARDPATPDA